MKKKTILVQTIKDSINSKLTLDSLTKEQRQVLISHLTDVLMQTGNYNGFKYLASFELPEGITPGIHVKLDDKGFYQVSSYEERFNNTDETRVTFY